MSTLRTTNVIHGSSAISNIVLDNQGRAIFGPDSPAGRAALYVNAQNNRVGVNTESPAVALDVDGAINATGNVAFGGTLSVTGNVSFNGASLDLNSDLDLTGTLDVTGNSTFTGDVGITGDLTVDTNTLFVDSSSNYVGIGTVTPINKLAIEYSPGSGNSDGIRLFDTTNSTVSLFGTTGSTYNYAGVVGATTLLYGARNLTLCADNANTGRIDFTTNGAVQLRIQSDGNVCVGPPLDNGIAFTVSDTNGGIANRSTRVENGENHTYLWQTSGVHGEAMEIRDAYPLNIARLWLASAGTLGQEFYIRGGLRYRMCGGGNDATSGGHWFKNDSAQNFTDPDSAGLPSSLTVGHQFIQSTDNTAGLHIYHTSNNASALLGGLYVKFTRLNPNNTTSYVFTAVDNLNANIYTINSNGTVTARSDGRLKKNIVNTRDGYLDDLMRLKVRKYNWITQEDNEQKELGLIAQEVQEVFPGLVQEGNDENKTLSIKTSVIPLMLLKALQEANEKIIDMESRIATLENT